MKLSFRGLFKRGRKEEGRGEPLELSLEDAESSLRMYTVERELIRILLDLLGRAREEGVIAADEADRLDSKYRIELEKVENGIEKYTGILRLLELQRVRDSLYRGYWERVEAVEEAMRRLAASIGMEATPLLRPPRKPERRRREETPASKGLRPLRDEILEAMEKLEEMEVEG